MNVTSAVRHVNIFIISCEFKTNVKFSLVLYSYTVLKVLKIVGAVTHFENVTGAVGMTQHESAWNSSEWVAVRS